MFLPLGALLLSATLAQQPASRTVELVLPQPLRENEIAWVVVTLGTLPRGTDIRITTPSGRPLGVISAYSIRPGQESYSVPLPSHAISGTRVSLRLSLDFNGKQRAPTKKEVKKVRLKVSETK